MGAVVAGCGDEVTATPTPPSGVTTSASATVDTGPAPTGPATSPDTAAPAAGSAAGEETITTTPVMPDVDRAMNVIQHLSVGMGPRPAGSEEELETAHYLLAELQAAGYTAELDEFTFQADRDNSLVGVRTQFIVAAAMRGSPNGEVRGPSVFLGLGEPADIAGADLRGKVAVFHRGVVTFYDKARAAQAGGAVAVLIVNNEEGYFFGSLGDADDITIPVLSVRGEDGALLLDTIGETVSVLADVGTEMSASQNVVGRTGERCHAYLGAHYDSVPPSPGANDNASGVAVVLEVARARHIDGLCIVFFGAEELGLFGSRHYVENNLVGMARFMLNVDMAGRLNGSMIVGDEGLQESIIRAAPNSPLRPGVFPPFASSDHAPFASVGVPAVTITGGADETLHTPLDEVGRIERSTVEMFIHAVIASLDALVEEHANVLSP